MQQKHIPILMILLSSFIYILPILLANVPFADDIWRITSGYPGFMENGRFSSEWLMYIISAGHGVFDAFPYPQIIASFIYWYSGYILSKKISEHDSEVNHFIIGSTFLICPFTTAQISFRFDSIVMSLSILFAVLAFLTFDKPLKSILKSSLCILISLGFYQPSLMLMLSIPLMAVIIKREKIAFKETIISLINYSSIVLAIFVFYKKFVILIFGSGNYANAHGNSVSLSTDSIPLVKESIKKINEIFYDLFSSHYSILLCILSLMSVTALIINFRTNKEPLSSLFFRVVLFALTVLLIYFPICLLENPILEPRVFSSACIFIFFLLCMSLRLKKYGAGLAFTLIFVVQSLFIFSMYSNVLKQSYERDLSFNAELSSLLISNNWQEGDAFYFSGKLQRSDAAQRFMKRFPFYERVLQHYYIDSYILGYDISNNNGLKIRPGKEYTYPLSFDKWSIVALSNYGTLYKKNNEFIFKFRN